METSSATNEFPSDTKSNSHYLLVHTIPPPCPVSTDLEVPHRQRYPGGSRRLPELEAVHRKGRHLRRPRRGAVDDVKHQPREIGFEVEVGPNARELGLHFSVNVRRVLILVRA